MRSVTWCLVATLVIVALAGCIDEPDPTGDETVDDDQSGPKAPTAATYHRPKTGIEAETDGNGSNPPESAIERPRFDTEGKGLFTGFRAFEPTLGVTSQGNLFMSTISGFLGTDYVSMIRSTDGGHEWEAINPSIGPVSSPPQSNDPYLYVDRDTDRVYNLDMQGLFCNYIQWSDDEGDSWTMNPLGCGQPPLLDHPTIYSGTPRELEPVGYENIVYLCVNRVADSACASSLDGGQSWLGFIPVFPGAGSDGVCGGLHGHGVTGPEGRAYLGKNQCGTPSIAVSEDDGLTWQTHAISQDVPAQGHDVELAVDDNGTVYALWADSDDLPRLAYSKDHGESWSEPLMIAIPDLETTSFATLDAGAQDRVAIVYYGTTSEKDMSDMDGEDVWHAYIAVTTEATSDDPLIATVLVDPEDDPMARGPCDDNNRCSGVGDFIDIVIDKEGRPWAALVDVCDDECDEEGGNDASLGKVGTLAEGPALRGELRDLPSLSAPDTMSQEETSGSSPKGGSRGFQSTPRTPL